MMNSKEKKAPSAASPSSEDRKEKETDFSVLPPSEECLHFMEGLLETDLSLFLERCAIFQDCLYRVNEWMNLTSIPREQFWSKHIADSVLAVDPKQGVIVMGDLNDDPFNTSCAEVLGAVRKAKDVKENGFYNPWWDVLDKGIGSLAYRGQWNPSFCTLPGRRRKTSGDNLLTILSIRPPILPGKGKEMNIL